MRKKGTLRNCDKGHKYYKSSDCPTCPTCEKLKKPAYGFLSLLSSPARNALLHHGIDSVKKLSSYTEKEIKNLHGIGKASLPVFIKVLEDEGLTFRQKAKNEEQSKNDEDGRYDTN